MDFGAVLKASFWVSQFIVTFFGDGWVTLWKGRGLQRENQKVILNHLVLLMSIDPNLVILEIRVQCSSQKGNPAQIKTENTQKFRWIYRWPVRWRVMFTKKSHAPKGCKVLFCFTKKTEWFITGLTIIWLKSEQPLTHWTLVFVWVCLDWKKNKPPWFLHEQSLFDWPFLDDLPSTKNSAAEQGKLSPNESRHQLHPNEFLDSRHQGKHITPPVGTRAFLRLENWYNKKTQGVQAAESHYRHFGWDWYISML